jgi:hypothetical protein
MATVPQMRRKRVACLIVMSMCHPNSENHASKPAFQSGTVELSRRRLRVWTINTLQGAAAYPLYKPKSFGTDSPVPFPTLKCRRLRDSIDGFYTQFSLPRGNNGSIPLNPDRDILYISSQTVVAMQRGFGLDYTSASCRN